MAGKPRTFDSLAAESRCELRVMRSRFVGIASPIAGEEDARARLARLRSEFPGATHHCWASVLLGADVDVLRTHDAGEPPGTAGPPILQAIRNARLTNVIVVVVRYFGGTKLGKGGLARAYREAARLALEGAPRVAQVPMISLRIIGPLARDGEMRHQVARRGGRVENAAYDGAAGVSLLVTLPAEAERRLRDDLTALTRGVCRFERPASG